MGAQCYCVTSDGISDYGCGEAIYAASLLFSLLGSNELATGENLVKEPSRYRLKRPLDD